MNEGKMIIHPRGPVKGFGYRKAQVKGGIEFTPNRTLYDHTLKKLERAAGFSEFEGGNHVVFLFDGLAVQFNDGSITISTEYVESC